MQNFNQVIEVKKGHQFAYKASQSYGTWLDKVIVFFFRKKCVKFFEPTVSNYGDMELHVKP